MKKINVPQTKKKAIRRRRYLLKEMLEINRKSADPFDSEGRTLYGYYNQAYKENIVRAVDRFGYSDWYFFDPETGRFIVAIPRQPSNEWPPLPKTGHDYALKRKRKK